MGIAIFSKARVGLLSTSQKKPQFQLLLPGFPVDTLRVADDIQQVRRSDSKPPDESRSSTLKISGVRLFSGKAGARAHCDESSTRLKIVRQFEQGSNPLCAGRMTMSGRMADVCAELERLAVQLEH